MRLWEKEFTQKIILSHEKYFTIEEKTFTIE